MAGGYKLYTKPQQHDVVRRFIKSLRPPLRLSMPALETLAVIAYKQPVTSPEISEIRGVNTSGVISTLLDKHLITTAGRKEVMGRPILYKTSREFLMRFGLSDLEELPSLKEFEALAREALGSDEGFAPAEAGLTNEASIERPAAAPAGGQASQATAQAMTDLLAENQPLLEAAAAFVAMDPEPSTLGLQKHFEIGWQRAMNLAEVLQERGLWPRCPTRQGLKRTCTLFKGHTRGHVFEI